MSEQFDVLVIGAGPGGYVAAIRAAQLGLKTAIVEKEHFGGICLNWGCIPTKALLRTSEVYQQMKNASEYGLKVDNVQFDINDIVSRSRKVSARLSGGVSHLMKKNKIARFDGEAKIVNKGEVEVSLNSGEQQNLKSKHIIIATGARARILPFIKVDHKNVITYKEALIPTKLPQTLMVIGSGAIGIEFANFYAEMGCKVTLAEAMDKILIVEDNDISDYMEKSLRDRGIDVITSAKITNVESSGDKAKVTINGKETEFEQVLSAVGVVPNVENIGLETVGIKLSEKGFIEIDKFGKTSVDGIYAIGDVAGAPCLAHKASHEAVICVEKISGHTNVHGLKRENIPGCTYTHPQIASIGITEAQALKEGYQINVGKFPLNANGKAIAMSEDKGFVKAIFDKNTGELLGAHMIGAEVTELISTFSIAKSMEAVEEDFETTIFPHPSLGETIHEAVLASTGKALHI